ncbi:MAG: FMN-binding protein [Candidatus Omnitrophota bacterium]|nr:FMN-binding protein [Candidatus Omnitrophota bacterium]
MKQALRIIIFVVLMGTISGVLLVGINATTATRIAKNEELKLKSAILDVLEISYTKQDILDVFDKGIKVKKSHTYIFYESLDKAVAFEFYGPGLWGPIHGIVSINPDFKTIRTLKILYQEETPGLGGRIAEKTYLSQFKNKEFLPKIIFSPSGKSKANNEVDAITGATGSSRALEKLLNETLQKNIDILKG